MRKTLVILLMALLGATAASALSPNSMRYVPADSLAETPETLVPDTTLSLLDRAFLPLPGGFYGPVVFDHYRFVDSLSIPSVNPTGSIVPDTLQWLADALFRQRLASSVRQAYMIDHPERVSYNMASLPEPPAAWRPTVDPRQHKFHFDPLGPESAAGSLVPAVDFDRRNWLNTVDASIQFSQSYLSPNWYQGGDGMLNAIGSFLWTIKLNPAFHPRLLFETSVQYKLALNTAPDDSVHAYNVSEDIFRLNSKVGIKAFDRWFYSLTLQFKTQMLNSYKKNSDNLVAAFLSPSELNMGLGMSYSYERPSGTLNFDASISPVAWNMKTCVSDRIDPTTFGIGAGHHVKHEIGANLECKFRWALRKNITYTSRLFFFSNYTYAQGDWENTIQFDVSRYLSTQVFVHLRYDSSTRPAPEARWRYWQLKEILSFGLSYSFATAP